MMNSAQLNIFSSRLASVCDDMGVVLRNAAFSPNIRDRLDYSCAVFDVDGQLCAQAAHIPVHLGSMAFAMQDIVQAVTWQEGDQLILNDPFLGGTHLPDVTLIAPVFYQGVLMAFVVNRAHHADIGADTPGSMPISATLEEEGLVISPRHIVRQGLLSQPVLGELLAATRNKTESEGDFSAQMAANRKGVDALLVILHQYNADVFRQGLVLLNDYAERLARASLSDIPDGEYHFTDYLDDDGQGTTDIVIKLRLCVSGSDIFADFSGTAGQVAGNVNCPLAVAAAGVYYVFRCLMPDQTPACAGAFRPLTLSALEGSLLNALSPAAVAAGNVETSTRVVDVVMGALAQAVPELIPAASHGSMNNLAMGAVGDAHWDYYETMGGGMGAGRQGGGLSAIQTHMTNTLNTPIEVLENRFPLRVLQYAIRDGSGGDGERIGGSGLIREFEFLSSAHFTLLTERRSHQPWSVGPASAGQAGENSLNGRFIGGKCEADVDEGDRLKVATPGGGGWSS